MPEEVEVFVPPPGRLGNSGMEEKDTSWLFATVRAVAAALRDAPVPKECCELDGGIPAQAELYTEHGEGPLSEDRVAQLENGTLVALVDAKRHFIYPSAPELPKFVNPRVPLVDGRPVEIEPLASRPRILMLRNVISDEECDGLLGNVGHLKGDSRFKKSAPNLCFRCGKVSAPFPGLAVNPSSLGLLLLP